MKKIFMLLLFTILLTGCSYNNDNTNNDLIFKHFETNNFECVNNVITIKIYDNESNDDLIAKGNLLLNEIGYHDMKIKIYKYKGMIPTMILLEGKYIDDNYIVVGYTFNSKEKE